MDLIQNIRDVGKQIQELQKKKKKEETNYKFLCSERGIKIPKEGQDDDLLAGSDSRLRSIAARSEDDETLFSLRKDTEMGQK